MNKINLYYDNNKYSIGYIINPFKKYISKLFILSFIINLLTVFIPISIIHSINEYNQISTDSLYSMFFISFIVLVINIIFRKIRTKKINTILKSIDTNICKEIFNKIFKIPTKIIEIKGTTFWNTLFTDIDSVRQGLSESYIINMFDLPFVLLFIILSSFLLKQYFYIPIIILIIYLLIIKGAKKLLISINEKEKIALSARNELIGNTINNLSNFKNINISNKIINMWNDYQQNIIDNTYKKNYILEIFSTLNIFTHFLGIILLSSIGIFLYKNHITNLGELISVLILLTQSFYLINTFVEYLPQYFNFIRSTEKLSLIMAEQIENLKTKEITELVNGNLILNKIQLTDNKNNLILNNTNFEFNDGLPYLIQGENNFKKSLFLQTLFGKVELLNGTIKFDNYNINEIKTDSLNNFIHYLPTNSFVFDGTIKENLNLFASTNITDKQFSGYTDYKKLCHYLGFDEVIKKLPNQENTIINIKTDLLTQEELRLLNIIRVLVGNPRILLLEEPFNELSNFYKDKLINYLQKIASTKIVIISTEICVFEKQIVLNISNKNIQKKIENKIESNTTNGEENRALFKRLLKK